MRQGHLGAAASIFALTHRASVLDLLGEDIAKCTFRTQVDLAMTLIEGRCSVRRRPPKLFTTTQQPDNTVEG